MHARPQRHAVVALNVVLLALAGWACVLVLRTGRPVGVWEFAQGPQGWTAGAQVEDGAHGPGGWSFRSTGSDPQLVGPPTRFPGGDALRFRVRMRVERGETAQVFWGAGEFDPARCVSFSVVPDGLAREYGVRLPPMARGDRLRFDPTTAPGRVQVEWVQVDRLPPLPSPALRAPPPPPAGAAPVASASAGDLGVVHYGRRWGALEVTVHGRPMAAGNQAEVVGIQLGDRVEYHPLRGAACEVRRTGPDSFEEVARWTDGAWGRWVLRREVKPGPVRGTLAVETSVQCDHDRAVLHVPWLTLLPGLGTFGTAKSQALFAGVEYLDNEPSSSDRDLRGPVRIRRVPAPTKLTLPLMALCAQERCLAVLWEPSPLVAPVFDSPDRVFHSGAHLLALWAPGVGERRDENALFAHAPFRLAAGEPARARMVLSGRVGRSVVPALCDAVDVLGLPPTPDLPGGAPEAVRRLAAGWADSACYDGQGRWAHAAGWEFQPAADAVFYGSWLAPRVADPALRARLEAALAAGRRRLEEEDPGFVRGVSHVRPPSTHLVLGRLAGYLDYRRGEATGRLGEFDAEGIRRYRPPPGGLDLGATHDADHANGLAAQSLAVILGAALLTGDETLSEKGVALLDRQTRLYADSVPRGAQTWEVPLHTPDILASAHLVRCYVAAYELTGRADLLDQAVYWAWTGVPFVYLRPAASGPVGPYATLAVLGATKWKSPVWIGLPVQWCGMVYASAVARLARHDPGGPWAALARGIAASGLVQTWPADAPPFAGCLPDSYTFASRSRNPPHIVPGTVQSGLPYLLGEGPYHEVRRAAGTGWLVHAPCTLALVDDRADGLRCVADGWPAGLYALAFARVAEPPVAVLAGPPGRERAPAEYEYLERTHVLIVRGLTGPCEVEVRRRAPPAAAAPAGCDAVDEAEFQVDGR